MNAADVQEVVLVVVSEKAFHLRRIHTAVGLADVDYRQIETREDVHFHSLRQSLWVRQAKLLKDGTADGQKAPERYGQNEDHHR